MNFDFDIKKKRVKIMLVALIGIICYAFLPYISVEAMGVSESRNFLSGDLFFKDGFVFCSLVGVVCLAAFIGIIATAYMKKTNENLLCCLGGGVAGVVSLIATLITCGSVESEAASAAKQFGVGFNVSVGCGIGFWIGIIALIACAAMAFLLPEDSNQ